MEGVDQKMNALQAALNASGVDGSDAVSYHRSHRQLRPWQSSAEAATANDMNAMKQKMLELARPPGYKPGVNSSSVGQTAPVPVVPSVQQQSYQTNGISYGRRKGQDADAHSQAGSQQLYETSLVSNPSLAIAIDTAMGWGSAGKAPRRRESLLDLLDAASSPAPYRPSAGSDTFKHSKSVSYLGEASGGSSVLQHRRPSGGVELNHGRMTSFGPYQPDSLPHRQSQGTVHWGETPALSVHRQSGVGELQGRASSVHRQSGGLGDLQSRASRRGEMQSSLSGGGGLQRRPSVGESSFRGPSSKSSLTDILQQQYAPSTSPPNAYTALGTGDALDKWNGTAKPTQQQAGPPKLLCKSSISPSRSRNGRSKNMAKSVWNPATGTFVRSDSVEREDRPHLRRNSSKNKSFNSGPALMADY